MKQQYQTINFRTEALGIIQKADEIMQEYIRDGFDLTLRQLYYQFVARGYLANNEKNYNKLGLICNNGRLAGLLDWDAMIDRTRKARTVGHWKDSADIVNKCSRWFRLDTREDQPRYIEVWVEKEALAGIVEPTANRLDINCLVCRGFVSQSAMYEAQKRFSDHDHQEGTLVYLGDHDPSGIDMNRDISDRLNETFGVSVEVRRIALTMEQVEQFNPPPNPAKQTDSRFKSYADIYGEESWELDALDPRTLDELIEKEVLALTDQKKWERKKKKEQGCRIQLSCIASKLADDPKWRP